MTFIKRLQMIVAGMLLGSVLTSNVQGKEATNFMGFYRQLAPLCDKKLDANPRELPGYSGILSCYEGKKRLGNTTEFWILQNGNLICGYWQLMGKKVWAGSFIGRIKNGKAEIFYEDGHQIGDIAQQYTLKKSASGAIAVFAKESKISQFKMHLVKPSLIDKSFSYRCPAKYEVPVMLGDHGQLLVKNIPDENSIKRAYGDIAEKIIYRAPAAKTITLSQQTGAFIYLDQRSGNNFVPRDIWVRNISSRVWYVRASCYPESENYFSYRLRDFRGVVKTKYKGYAVDAMLASDGVKVNTGETVRVLSCREFGVEFDPEGGFDFYQHPDVIKN